MVATFIARGWQQGAPDDDIMQVPLAEGGEGSTAALVGSQGNPPENRPESWMRFSPRTSI
ncbi:glycerate kinase [Marinobacter fonticola]|uniref:glycerate kinase n=1 Tax=Marinobacter fonticola TaxID=2603215 RepID=UPI001D0DA497|nr:glycerate kinase [Marinobacter fonticola]